jgi:hypothetical protein
MANALAWRAEAACSSTLNPEQFDYIQLGESERDRLQRLAVAKDRYCDRCPVAERCLQYGQSNGFDGLWGGVALLDGQAQLLPGLAVPEKDNRVCGTYGGWVKHRKERSVVCGPCSEARKRERRASAAIDYPCGTPAAYRDHYRRGEQPCNACRIAERKRQQERSAQIAEVKARRRLNAELQMELLAV